MEPTSLPDAVTSSERERRQIFTTDQSDEPIVTVNPVRPLVERRFTKSGEDPFDTVEWVTRAAWPPSDPNHMIAVDAPSSWSQQAVDITAKLYLAKGSSPETSVRQLINRVATRITNEGLRHGYLAEDDAEVFHDELVYVCLHQMATFNSPVWFNIGRDDRPQAPSACYLLGLEDNSESIMRLARDEAFIFKAGAGSGTNYSNLRGSMEKLSTGGTASGPVSFMRLPNAVAETIKSGGTTRRAAKIVQLDVDHPDIVDFVQCKVREEKRIRILGEGGMNISMDREGERNLAETTSYQSANNSVRVSDDFMRAVECGDDWRLIARTTGLPVGDPIPAQKLMREIADAAHLCADPGIMFDDTINSWHTTPADGRLRTSNPCGETQLPDNSSCNLGALNVVKFLADNGSVRCEDVVHVVDVMTTAMDILVEFCELPTEILVERTKRYRWLGLGCSNMGAAIMSKGLAYDSDAGRDLAASIMAIITGRCYRQSAKIAQRMGPFDGYADNRQSMLGIIKKHRDAILGQRCNWIWDVAEREWRAAEADGTKYGFRNAQASVIAPGGTTSFFMDCDTTGIEPSFSLVQYKDLAGGGSMVLVNESVGRALKKLGYESTEIKAMLKTLRSDGVDALMMAVEPAHHAVFHGANDISVDGHIKMLGAVQPFISGAASKTCNMPASATPSDIRDAFVLAWKLGVKCIAVYRDGSKSRQVLSSKKKVDVVLDDEVYESLPAEHIDTPVETITPQIVGPQRRRLPRTRPRTVRHKISVQSSIGLHEGYVSASFFDDGSLGEVFLEGFGKMGGFTQNALSAWMTGFSVALQYGVPFDVLVRKHIGHSDETGGMVTPDHDGQSLVIRSCDSMIDYVARWLVAEAGDVDLQEELGVMTDAVKARRTSLLDGLNSSIEQNSEAITKVIADAPKFDEVYKSGLARSAMRLGMKMRSGTGIEGSAVPIVTGGQAPVGMSENIGILPGGEIARMLNGHSKEAVFSAQLCPECRKPMRRAGACLQCSCGYSSGGCS